MRRVAFARFGASVVIAVTALAVAGPRAGAGTTAQALDPGAAVAGTSSNFTLVGHEPLYNRGENAAITLYGHYVYIGSRTDSEPHHLHPGVLVVDAADPSQPKVVNEVSVTSVDPHLVDGYTSRELRVWPQQQMLMVVYMSCSDILHQCAGNGDVGGPPNFQQIAFFDISTPSSPRLVTTFVPKAMPHELFLWVDPANPAGRALVYSTSPNQSGRGLALSVFDISKWRSAQVGELAHFDVASLYTAAEKQLCPLPDDGTSPCYDVRLHSISLTPDGTQLYMAHLGGGVLVADTHEVAAGTPNPKITLVTPIAQRAYWDNQGAHSAVKIPGRPYLFTTEEIYGKLGYVGTQAFGRALSGCPWGWARVVDIADAARPTVVSQYKIDKNQQTSCTAPTSPGYVNVLAEDNFSSYASHNPTVLPDLALVTWHSGGLRAVDLRDPANPVGAGFFLPAPNAYSVTPDPALEPGSNGVIAWSYPIISNGLIYFIDIRNGLYIVKYTGTHAQQVQHVRFLEGNSNVGDAYRLEYGDSETARVVSDSVGAASPAEVGLPMTGGAAGATVLGAGGVIAVVAGTVLVRRRRRRATG
ncbi:MAG TPA: LPXTG cell wall anchor domain-containing protein [Candidatus Angelobacter sp.]|jgi:LPXTG-motif cell wall-anchored protein|nr:LPXTG cell wall anchor domain-containing protein [Candidatus Angelobacter sp.]